MELELKFALPAQQPQALEKQLRLSALIGRRRPQRERLLNTYFDTPDHQLKKHGMALRIRQAGSDTAPRWVQTLKIGGSAHSALSQRGEWETPLDSHTLDAHALRATPWAAWDPDGAMFQALQPVFTTDFERVRWLLALPQGRVEVALDRGEVRMDGHCTPLCELEIELLEGDPAALFEAAEQLAPHVALLPSHVSKAERAYRLAQGTLYAPVRAKPPVLQPEMRYEEVAKTVLRECFFQFTANLNALQHSDAPEVLHQARIGWRRMKSLLKLLHLAADVPTVTQRQALKPLLLAMTALRDLDVAATEVLPLYAQAYQAGDAQRTQRWEALEHKLQNARTTQYQAVRSAMAKPAVGLALLQITRWLELATAPLPRSLQDAKPAALHKWLKKQVERLADALDAHPKHSKDPRQEHAVRILCKRLRYCVECLRQLLARKKAERWLRNATVRQTRIGLERDRLQALHLALQLQAAEGIVEFLRGADFGASL